MVLNDDGAERMAKILRHRLLNIVSGVKSANSLLHTMLEDRLEPQEREYFPLINKECDKICALVDRLNSFFGISSAPRPVALKTALPSVLKQLQAEFPSAEINLETDISDGDFLICGETLKTVLTETVDNAYGIERQPISVFVAQAGGTCLVRVVNPGKELPAKVLNMAFEPFYTERTKHLGLGLTIARRCVERVGGSASISSRPGVNVVEFEMPCLGEKDTDDG